MKILAVAIGLFAAVSVAKPADAQPAPEANEVQLAAGFFHTQDSDTGNFNLDAAYGRFLADPAWELGVRQEFQAVYNDDAPDAWNATTLGFVDYHFGVTPTNPLIPFVGGNLGIVWNDDELQGTIGPEAGLKAYMNDQTFVIGRYRYQWFFDDVDLGAEDDRGNHVVTIGLGYQWGGERRSGDRRL